MSRAAKSRRLCRRSLRDNLRPKRITPDLATLKKWARALPPDKDQIFLPSRFSLLATHGLELEKLASLPRKHWGLTERSWFGYLAGRAGHRIVLPRGAVESLPTKQKQALQSIQVKMKNPALVPSRLLPAALRGDARFTWLTSGLLRRLKTKDRIMALQAWDKAAKLTGIYPRISPSSLSAEARKILRERKLLELVNTFAPRSGPNCFAMAAYAISSRSLNEWMHAEPFLKIARSTGYRPIAGKPQPGDLLVCRQKEKAVHAALYLGGFVIEKPGQDLYEPYRLAGWRNWRKDWRRTRLEVWRKGPPTS